VKFPHALIEQLVVLTEALDNPGTDLQAVLSVLTDDLIAAIPSFLGLAMTLSLDGSPVAVTAADAGAELATTARTTLRLPLPPVAGTDPASQVVFYAADPGAFAHLAVDARSGFNLDGPIVLDGHLPTAAREPKLTGIDGLTEFSAINQAIGVFIAQGHTSAGAHARLRRSATEDGQPLHEAAQRVLDSLTADPGASDPIAAVSPGL
jgi:hypothetical protein